MNKKVEKILNDRLDNGIFHPLTKLIDENVSDIVTTFGRYAIRFIRGKLQRGITIECGKRDWWMEKALYNIFNRYNNIRKSTRVEFGTLTDNEDNNEPIYRLEAGQAHNLKYRDWNILVVVIAEKNLISTTGRYNVIRNYTIITSDTSEKFIKTFEADMMRERNKLLEIDVNSPYVNIYTDGHEYDGCTYWYYTAKINKRKLGTVYLPNEQKKILINTINNFFASKKYYNEHGIPHNLKILLYGPPGPQPVDTIIPTPNGDIRLGDLEVGSEVFAIDGSVTTIEEIYEYDDLDVYKITFSDDKTSLCGEDHQWPVITGTGQLKNLSVREMLYKGLTYDKYPHKPKFSIPGGPNNPYSVLTIENITNCNYKTKMRCLHINHPSHIYLTNDYIPTCNSGKDSLVKVIASEWNRNIYYVTGGKNGEYIPNSLIDSFNLVNPLFLISDIDKYPFLTNEATIDLSNKDDYKADQLRYKQLFGSMINALDGMLSGEDKLIIMTTNHPEVFSQTFLRDGRVDLAMHIDYMTPETFRQYVYDFYKVELPENIELKENNLSVAKLNTDVLFLKLSKEEFLNKYLK